MLAGVAFIVDILFVLTLPEAEWTNVVYIVAALLLVGGWQGCTPCRRTTTGA